MKKSIKFVKNDGRKEIVIKRAAETLSLHTQFDSSIRFIEINRNVTNDS